MAAMLFGRLTLFRIMLKFILGVMVAPVLALAMFALGLLAAVVHVIALPALFLWDRHLETKPIKSRRTAEHSATARTQLAIRVPPNRPSTSDEPTEQNVS